METQNIEEISPTQAEQYLALNTRNRRVSKNSLAFLCNEIKNGNWIFNGAPIIFAKSGKLIDGQHRLMAIKKTGVTKRFVVIRGIDDKAFITIDSGKPRSGADALSVSNVQNSTIIAASIRKILAKYGLNRPSVDNLNIKMSTTDIHDFYVNNKERLQNYVTLSHAWSKKGGSVVQHSDIVAMLWLLSKEDDKAYAFIEEVATGSYLGTIQLTAQTLRNKLIRSKAQMGKLREHEVRDLYLIAFRHYVAGNEVSKLIVKKGAYKFI